MEFLKLLESIVTQLFDHAVCNAMVQNGHDPLAKRRGGGAGGNQEADFRHALEIDRAKIEDVVDGITRQERDDEGECHKACGTKQGKREEDALFFHVREDATQGFGVQRKLFVAAHACPPAFPN